VGSLAPRCSRRPREWREQCSRESSLAGDQLLGEGKEVEAFPCDRDASAAGEVQAIGNLTGSEGVFADAEANDLRHTGTGAVPVHLEPFGVPLVQVVRSDEIKVDAVLIGADTGDDDDAQAAFGVRREKLGAGDFEFVGGSCSSHFFWSLVGGCFWFLTLLLYHPGTRATRSREKFYRGACGWSNLGRLTRRVTKYRLIIHHLPPSTGSSLLKANRNESVLRITSILIDSPVGAIARPVDVS